MNNNRLSHESAEEIAMKVSKLSVVVNVVLSVLKLLAGIIASSGAMISDAIHSASDVLSTIIVMVGIKASGKKADKEHPYGHERMESVAAILLSVALFLTGTGIGLSGLNTIMSGNINDIAVPGILALVVSVISIIVKEWMYWYTRYHAKKINSGVLMADAWHHRSDSLSSIGAFIGILGARMGFPIMDPLVSIIICAFILKVAYDIFKDAIDKMVDKSCDERVEEEMSQLVMTVGGVMRVDELHTRTFGNKIYVDLEIAADGHLTLNESHEIAENVHDKIEATYSNVKHIMIHVNPYISKKTILNMLNDVDKDDLEEVYNMLQKYNKK